MDVEKYLNDFSRKPKPPSMAVMEWFVDKYNHFDKNIKFIHVAGTNGKGSCVEILSNILQKQGYSVGKLISPHLIKYNERISINGKEITDKELSEIILELEPLVVEYNNIGNDHVTFFELITMIGLIYFYRNNVDFAILETGIGGLFDSTNVISKPLLSIITSIGYDHMQMLGNSLLEIAYQKAGIIKPDSNTIIFSQTPSIDKMFEAVCKSKNNKLRIVKSNDISNYSKEKELQYFDYAGVKRLAINLKGRVQVNNACVCIEAVSVLNELGYYVSSESIYNGIKDVIHKGRMEVLKKVPWVIYDGAHNEPAIRNLQQNIYNYFNSYKRIYVLSILKSKDYRKIIEIIAEDENSEIILTSGNDIDKFVSCQELYDYAIEYASPNRLFKCTLDEAIKQSLRKNSDVVIIFTGSFYVYNDVKKSFEVQ